MVPNYYAILGVGRKASTEEINLAYERTALLNHPDKFPEIALRAQRFLELLNTAQRILTSPEDRKAYDEELHICELETATKRQEQNELWLEVLEKKYGKESSAKQEERLKRKAWKRVFKRIKKNYQKMDAVKAEVREQLLREEEALTAEEADSQN